MKKYLILTTLALSIGAAHAQPPEAVPLPKPVNNQIRDWQQWKREQDESARRAPQSMLYHFVNAIRDGDYEAAADDVLGADNDPWVRSIKDRIAFQARIDLTITPLFNKVEGDKFTARVATYLNISESPLREEMGPLLMRFETVALQREGEFWKIVPRPAPEIATTAAESLAQARDESDGFLNQWARLLIEPPVSDETARQQRAAAAMVARQEPKTMLAHFVSTLNAGDLEMAAGDVVGGQNTPALQRLQEIVQRGKPNWQLVATPLFDAVEGDAATVQLTTSQQMDNYLVGAQTQALLTRTETVDLQRDEGQWRIVPRAPLSRAAFEGGIVFDPVTHRSVVIEKAAQAALENARDERDGFLNQWARVMPQPRTLLMRMTSRSSMSNLKQLSLGVMQLLQDSNEVYAFDKATFVKSVQPYVHSEQLFQVPALDEVQTGYYTFNPDLLGKNIASLNEVARTPMIYEAGKGPHGLDYRFDGQAAVAFADGHVALVSPEQADKLVWDILAAPPR